MSDDLVKRLRGIDRTDIYLYETMNDAADRIEELEAVIDHQHKRAETLAEGWRIADDARIELEAKLAKALLIIEAYGDDEGYIPKRVVHLWNELTGGKDD